jgi:hypothetical protein
VRSAGEGGRGPSLFDEPTKIPPRFTDVNKVEVNMLPPELEAVPIGRPGHFEILPRRPGMSVDRFLQLLREIGLEPLDE